MKASSHVLLILHTLIVIKTSEAALLKCADEIKCEDRSPGCAVCLAPASYASGFRCAVPKGFLGTPALLDSPYCHYCQSNGKCLGHKTVDATTCPDLDFIKFEEECTGPPGGSVDHHLTNDADTTDEFLSNWMGKIMELPKKNTFTELITLFDLSLVGSHDATSYDSDIVFSTSVPATTKTLVNNPQAEFIIDNFQERAMSFFRRAAETQFLNLTMQLNSGVRFLDFRINYETDVKDWYSLHTVRTRRNVWFYLEEIKQWMAQHPKEILVIWLSRQGSVSAKGTDQFPGATLDQKTDFWSRYTQMFDGMLIDVTVNPPQTTPLDMIAGKILTFASDYVELTSNSNFALDAAASLSNKLGKGILNYDGTDDISSTEYTYNFEQDQFSNATSTKQTEPNTFHLLSMSSSVSDDWAKYAPLVELNPISTEKASNLESCNALFDFPGFKKDWCPMSLMDVALLTNYYKQMTIEQARAKEEWDFPNAIYVDGIDVDGTIRTSTHLPWNQPRSDYFAAQGNDAVKRYAAIWATIERNIRIPCCDDCQDVAQCVDYRLIVMDGIRRNNDRRWDDPRFGRVLNWPEEHSVTKIINRPVGNDQTTGNGITSKPTSSGMCFFYGGSRWLLIISSSWHFAQYFFS